MNRQIKRGIYLIVNPAMDETVLLNKLRRSLEAGLCAVQLLNRFPGGKNDVRITQAICDLVHTYNIPVLVNNRWDLLQSCKLDGVHFDDLPTDIDEIERQVGRTILWGVTCGNDLNKAEAVIKRGADYISFCSIFPSRTQNSCELVSFETIKKVVETASVPVFLAGGITPENMSSLRELKYSGVAVVSGIMNADQPEREIEKYITHLNSSLCD